MSHAPEVTSGRSPAGTLGWRGEQRSGGAHRLNEEEGASRARGRHVPPSIAMCLSPNCMDDGQEAPTPVAAM
eukprot:468483-Hanusia_phi.AAC.2